tara:strand:+ start:1015 stop:1389 length:375 start_codon:yes stop_codon:yes gene_type:complete
MEERKSPINVAVPVKTAAAWTKNHRDDSTLESSKKRVNSYLIPRETLEMVLKLDTSKIRAYIGMNDKKESTLIFVGAELEDATGVYRDVFGTETLAEGEVESNVVYDFSEPNPPYQGDDESILN